jgi:hypothetical protein
LCAILTTFSAASDITPMTTNTVPVPARDSNVDNSMQDDYYDFQMVCAAITAFLGILIIFITVASNRLDYEEKRRKRNSK